MSYDTVIPKPQHMFSELIGSITVPFTQATNTEYLLRIQMKRGELKLVLNLLSNGSDRSPLLITWDKDEPQKLFRKHAGTCNIAYISEDNSADFCECAASLFTRLLKKTLSRDEIRAFALMRVIEFISLAELAPKDGIFIDIGDERFSSAIIASKNTQYSKPFIIVDFVEKVDTYHTQYANIINTTDFETYIKNYLIKENSK